MYTSIFLVGADNKMVDVHEFLDFLSSAFGLPMLRCEIHIILTKYQKRGRINIEFFIENLENVDGDNKNIIAEKKFSTKESEAFGKALFKKLCKLRSNETNKIEFRKALLAEDPDLNGSISKKSFQKVLDHLLDLSDAEGALLIENLCFPSNTRRNEIDYPLLLLLLNEPVKRSIYAIAAGTAMINKIMRGSDSVALVKLLSSLFRSFSEADPRVLGVIPLVTAEKIFKEECQNVESKFLTQVLETFLEIRSDCIQYPEMLSFLGSCSLWNVMNRLNHLDSIRQKQGYNFSEYLKNYVSKKNQKVDTARLFDIFLGLGILLPETGMSTIFSTYSGKGNNSNNNNSNLDVAAFVQAVADSDSVDVASKAGRNVIKPYEGKKR